MFSYFKKKSNRLLAVYDLDKINCSHDFLVFFQNAILFKKKNKLKFIDLCIIPGSFNGFKYYQFKREKNNQLEYAKSRLQNIVLPSIGMFKEHYENFYFFKSRDEFKKTFKKETSLFPYNYHINMDKRKYVKQCIWANLEKDNKIFSFTKMSVPNLVSKNVKNQINTKKKIITITLRESSYTVERNSSLKEWKKFIEYLEKKKFFIIVIRDFEKIYKNDYFKRYELFPMASYDIITRSALYKISNFNLFVNGGPQTICWINEYDSISWKVWGDGNNRGLHEDNLGLERDEKSKILNRRKNVLLSDDDNFLNLIKIKKFLFK